MTNTESLSGPGGLRHMTQEVIAGRDRRAGKNWRPENPAFHAFVMKQPFLFVEEETQGERQLQGIRFNLRRGSIYMPTWIHKATTGEETEVPFKTKKDGEGEMYLRWRAHNSIEAATRSTIHISRDYGPGGRVRQQTEDLFEFLDELGERFEQRAITREDLPGVVEETLLKLEETGFLKVIKHNKVKARKQLLETLAPDSLGRFPNLLIILTKLASTGIRVRHEQQSASKVTKKYEKWFDMLYEQRLYERLGVGKVLNRARNLRREFARRTDHSKFKNLVFRMRESTRDNFRADTIRTAPYRVPSLLFSIGLFGVNTGWLRYEGLEPVEEFVKKLIKTLPKDERAKYEDIFTQRPIDEIIRDPDIPVFERERQVIERVETYYTPLRRAYEEGRNWRQRSNGEMI